MDAVFYSTHTEINFYIFCGIGSTKPLQMNCKGMRMFGYSVPVKTSLQNKGLEDLKGFKVGKQTTQLEQKRTLVYNLIARPN